MKWIIAIGIVVFAALAMLALPVAAGCSESECAPAPAATPVECGETECSGDAIYHPAPTPVIDPLPTIPPNCVRVEGVIRCKPVDSRPPKTPPGSGYVPTPVIDWPLAYPAVIYDVVTTRAGGDQILRVR